MVIADDPEIGDKVRDTARLCTPLASIDGARRARASAAPHTGVQFAALASGGSAPWWSAFDRAGDAAGHRGGAAVAARRHDGGARPRRARARRAARAGVPG